MWCFQERGSDSTEQKSMVWHISIAEKHISIFYIYFNVCYFLGQSRLSSQMDHWRSFCWPFVTSRLTTRNGGMGHLLSSPVRF